MSFGYADIAAHFRQKIIDGELSPGDRLPPVRQISEDFHVAGTTTNRAFQALKREGLIETHPGAGTLVAPHPDQALTGVARLSRLERTGRGLSPGEDVTNRMVRRLSCADPEICTQLDIEPHDEVVIRTMVYRQDGKPVRLGVAVYNCTATSVVPELESEEPGATTRWKGLHKERTGREIHASPERRSARFADQHELAAFKLPLTVAAPVLVLRVTLHDERGPLAYWEDTLAPGQEQVST
ncbi:GntR family transcriptional regulator [Streptomyces sp. NPDC088731]|uniref:GntR family transcriptional regulator n=1 Tax=Streptomyces sp. NPDC088731 TaxID=3365878 RepID=UPI00381D4E65